MTFRKALQQTADEPLPDDMTALLEILDQQQAGGLCSQPKNCAQSMSATDATPNEPLTNSGTLSPH